jgi:hypothetical protein
MRLQRPSQDPEERQMTRTFWLVFSALISSACSSGGSQDDAAPVPTMSINDLMVAVITPATDVLWGIEDPQTDEEWQVFIDAAEVVIDAGKTIKVGGTGPSDNAWAQSPQWQEFADQLISAGEDAKLAAQDKNLEAMFAAGDVLYPPCEECHIAFHPGVQ